MYFAFLRYQKIYYLFSAILILAATVCLFSFGLNLGIEFTGGSIMEIEFKTEPLAEDQIREILKEFGLEKVVIQSIGEKGLILRMKEIDEKKHQQILKKFKEKADLEEQRFEMIGPIIGKELTKKTKIAILLALFAIVFYVALAFRRLKRPLSSWQYGLVSLICLFHDVFLPLGVFSLLGKFYQVEITIPIIAALLAVLGYSINNTVVMYDRIRENLFRKVGISYAETVEKSINQNLWRCINTSLTTLLVLFFIFFLGGQTLKYFALALILGISAGTYSSIFLACPLLCSFAKKSL